MDIKPIKKRKRIYQEIIDRIKESIESGELSSGDKLPSERALAEMLGVSRTSVKEAISALETAGVVNIRPGVGVFVAEQYGTELLNKFSTIIDEKNADLIQLIELRQAIEGDAAYYAAKRITLVQKDKLATIFHKLVEAERKGELAVEEDLQFHLAIVEAAHNPLMLNVMNIISDKLVRELTKNREQSILNFRLNKEVMEEHRRIYKAIIEQDPLAARQNMWAHLKGIKQRRIY
ncbi:FadR/GntR family transcriptional regulator [Bacillus sp. Marseille-P3661]|uniref:FadR/GntR family transcriptional regulator n=1 Tax=Bacillus sp. Marseille-P3661 TaxID=1936234 RepID=UPI000C850889|nr:FadR/GntR family transcriptional regulator [Bacillus sp. Marseille-P3661]